MARGFNTTSGSASTDAIATTLTANGTSRAYAFWIYSNTWPVNGCAFAKSSSNRIDFQAGPVLRFLQIFSGATNGDWNVPAPSTGAWHHIVLVYDNSSTANVPVIYVDGVSATVTTTTSPAGTVVTNANPFYIGNRVDGLRPIDGLLAEWAVWDTALSASEAAALGAGVSPLLVDIGFLVDYLPLVDSANSRLRAASTVTGTLVKAHVDIVNPRPARVGRAGDLPPPRFVSSDLFLPRRQTLIADVISR